MTNGGLSTTIIMLIVLLAALIVSAVICWRLIPFLKSIGASQTILDDAPERHKTKIGTPTMGGVGILSGIIVGGLVAMILTEPNANLAVAMVASLLFGMIGFVDDHTKVLKKRNLGLTAKQKLLLQIIVSIGIALYYVFIAKQGTELVIPFIFKRIDIGYFIIPYIVFVVVAMVNAVNLTDGLDGLAGGVTTTLSLFYPIIISVTALGMQLTSAFGFTGFSYASSMANTMFFPAVAGACLGFLLFNRHPARIFMGDTGSLALGGGIAAAAIMTHSELYLPIVGLIFVIEAASDIIQVASYKLRKGKRVFRMAPIHHHFELGGWSEKKVVTVFVSITAALGVLAVGGVLLGVFVIT